MHQSIPKPRAGRTTDHGTDRTTAQRQQVANLIDNGCTYAVIAKIIGKSISRVHAIHNELRGKPKPPRPSRAKQPKYKRPWAKMPPDIETKVRELLATKMPHADICRLLKLHKSSVSRVAARVREGDIIRPTKRNPAKCSGEENCECVYHAAEAFKRNRKAAM